MASVPDWAKPASPPVPSYPPVRRGRDEAGSSRRRRRHEGHARDRGRRRHSRSTGYRSHHTREVREEGRSRSTRDRKSKREYTPDPPSRKSSFEKGEKMGLREYLLEKRKGRDESKAFVPEKSGSAPSRGAGVSCPELGKTSGLHAVGAWAARMEIAKLLEAGVDPSLVVKAVRSGKEGDSPLDLSPPMFTGEPMAEEVEPLSPKGSRASPPSSRKFEVDEASELARLFGSSPQEQQLLLNEAGAFAGSPDWAEGSSPSILFRKRAEIPKDLNVQMVTKYSLNFLPPTGALQPPQIEKMSESFDTEGEESEEEQVGEAAVEEEDERSLDFKKKARLPMPEELKHPEEPVKPPPKPNYGRPADERDKLEKFYKRSLDLFEVLVVAGVKMDLVDLVVITKDDSKEPSIDEKRFRLHVEPKGAGTGLGYVRLMERLVKFHEDYVERDEEELTPVSRAAVLAFTEHLISEEAGFKTPKSPPLCPGLLFGFLRLPS